MYIWARYQWYGYRRLYKSAEQISTEHPAHFFNKKSGEIEIDDLIRNIVKSKSANDEFVQKAVLVLGTVVAPHSTKYVPKSFYCLVENIK